MTATVFCLPGQRFTPTRTQQKRVRWEAKRAMRKLRRDAKNVLKRP